MRWLMVFLIAVHSLMTLLIALLVIFDGLPWPNVLAGFMLFSVILLLFYYIPLIDRLRSSRKCSKSP